jgi:GTP pyrophosphokinase
MLDKELRRLGIKTERQALADLFSYPSLDDFFAAVGAGNVTSNQIVTKLAAQEEKTDGTVEVAVSKTSAPTVRVLGMADLVTTLGQCCRPVPGDKIIGYITRSRGVTIHRQDCHNVINEDERERLVPVEWGQSDVFYPVNVKVEAWDRVGLMRDVTTLVAEAGVNIGSVSLANGDGHSVNMFLTLETKGLAQLSQILKKIDGVRGVSSVTRIGGDAIKPPGAGAAASTARGDNPAPGNN